MLEWKWREKDIAVEFDVPDITIKVMKTYFIKYGVISLRIALNFQTTVGPLSFCRRVRV